MFFGYDTVQSDTVALYQLNGNLLDSGPNNLHLSLLDGIEEYADVYPGVQGFRFNGKSAIGRSIWDATLALTDNFTITALVSSDPMTASFNNRRFRSVIAFTRHTSTSNSTTNTLYDLSLGVSTESTSFSLGVPVGAVSNCLTYLSHHGNRVSSDFSGVGSIVPGNCVQLRVVRNSNVITFYINDLLVGTASSALTTPDGGSASTFRIGGASVGTLITWFIGSIASVHIRNGAHIPGDPPFLINQVPVPAATSVAINSTVAFRIDDLAPGVDATTPIIKFIRGSHPQVTVYNASSGGFQTGYSGSATHNDNHVDFNIIPATPFDYSEIVQVEAIASDLSSLSMDQSYSFTTIVNDPPFITNQAPTPGDTNVVASTNVNFRVDDTTPGIDASTLVIKLKRKSTDTLTTIYTAGGGFISGYTGSATHTGNHVDVIINPNVNFESMATVTVEVQVSDLAGASLDTTYSFTIAFTETPILPFIKIDPNSGNIRGGTKAVVFGSAELVDETQDVSFKSQTLPAGWTTSSAISTLSGCLIIGGATLTSPDSYESFSSSLSYKIISPKHQNTSATTLLTFEFISSGDSSVKFGIKVQKDTNNLVSVYGYINGVENLTSGTTVITELLHSSLFQEPVLTLVHHDTNVWFLLDNVEIWSFNRFNATTGHFKITAGSEIKILVQDLTIRSHATINGKLLINKADLSKNRITGLIPETSLENVGSVDLVAFGPWGDNSNLDGFEYLYPKAKSLSSRLLFTYKDPSVKD